MSVLARLQKEAANAGTKALFAIVAGPRLGGKSTLAGTLPGHTVMLQAAVLESGSGSAVAKAAETGSKLDVLTFMSVAELQSVLNELRDDTTYDNVYIDGLSAITEMLTKDPKIAKAINQNTWDGFRMLGEVASEVLLTAKALTYSEIAKKPKNTFVTCALRIKQEGNTTDVELESKGRMAVTAVTKLGEAVLTVLPPVRTEAGESDHILVTKTDGCWPGRIDGVLRERNPGTVQPADLSKVLQLLKGN